MAKDYAKAFYTSERWQKVRKLYMQSVDGLCERCLAIGIYNPGKVVHHKKHLTPQNITDPTVALDFGNLELLCQDCHNEEHHRTDAQERYSFGEDGEIIVR